MKINKTMNQVMKKLTEVAEKKYLDYFCLYVFL